jgi:hypothetical protein
MVFREPAPILEKVFKSGVEMANGRDGTRPPPEIVPRNYASIIATISCVRGLMMTICSPTRM